MYPIRMSMGLAALGIALSGCGSVGAQNPQLETSSPAARPLITPPSVLGSSPPAYSPFSYPSTTHAPPPHIPAPPGAAQISAAMIHTVELGTNERFSPEFDQPVTVSDGQGGYLTAERGIRSPSADGYGQLVFFWHNRKFLGWDSKYESLDIVRVWASGPRQIAVSYAQYGDADPLCCPSKSPVVVYYSWQQSHLASSGAPPGGPSIGNRVIYQ